MRRTLRDGNTYYGRLLEFPWAAFYDLRTSTPEDDMEKIAGHGARFTIAAQKDLVTEWETLGVIPLDGSLQPPAEQYIHDEADPGDWRIIDAAGEIRPATQEECEGLEPAEVYEPEHVEARLTESEPTTDAGDLA